MITHQVVFFQCGCLMSVVISLDLFSATKTLPGAGLFSLTFREAGIIE